MKLIGKGLFSRIYLLPCGTRVAIKSNDHAKECLAHKWGSDSPLFPVVDFSDNPQFDFEMEYLPRPRSIKNSISPHQWEFYQTLRSLPLPFFVGHSDLNFYHWKDMFESLPAKFFREKEALQTHLDGLSNFGADVCFEISPRNITVKNGKLILLDCFFFESQAKEAKEAFEL